MSVFHASSAGNIGQPASTGPPPTTPPSGDTGGGDTTTPPSGAPPGGDPLRKGPPPRLHAQRASISTKRRIMVIETIGPAAFNPPEGRGSGSTSACSSGGQASRGVLLAEDPRAEDAELIADDHRQGHQREVERV